MNVKLKGLILIIDGVEKVLSLEEGRALYDELYKLFGKVEYPTLPIYPTNPSTTPSPYPWNPTWCDCKDTHTGLPEFHTY